MVIKQDKYMLGTIKEIAKELYDVNKKDFIDCDFTLIDDQDIDLNNKDIDLNEICHDSTGLYGIKNIDTGFDIPLDNNLNLFADYYGGGYGTYRFICTDYDIDNIYYNIKKIIVDVLCCEGYVTGDSIIICEINREENHE